MSRPLLSFLFDDAERRPLSVSELTPQVRTAYTITYASNASASGGDAREARVRVRVNTDGASVRLSPSVSVVAP